MMLSKIMEKTGVPSKPAMPGKPVESEDDELAMGIAHESAEHGWLSPAQVRRLTKDHLRENPSYYSELEEMESHEDAEEAGEDEGEQD